jgi:lipopolysaccharide/colanic/teichoic acid biosynthesis glycosyltransferase
VRPDVDGASREDAVRPGLPRAVDAVVSAAGLVATAPLIAVCAAAVLSSAGRPAFFRQVRVGRGGRPFTLIKLRTMRPSQGGPQVTASGDSRITRLGRFLRRSKLDELPELWNVLRGDMALVGPRPEVPGFVDAGRAEWKVVLSVRPGLTDPVTLRLRNEEAVMAASGGDQDTFYRNQLQPLKLRGYVEYLHRRSWWSDLRVLGSTLLVVLGLSRAPLRGEMERLSEGRPRA